MTRSFLIDAFLPASYWLDALYAAVFTINRLRTPILKDKSPYEVLLTKVPDYGLLETFGCACFPHFIATFANKLSPRSVQCVFLCYAPHYQGYRCLDQLTNRVYIVVMFDFLKIFFLSLLLPPKLCPIIELLLFFFQKF